MHLEARAEFAKCIELLFRESARDRPERIKKRRRVSFGKNEAVVVVILRMLHVEPKETGEEKYRHEVGRRKRRCGVAGPGGGGGRENVVSYYCRELPEFPHIKTHSITSRRQTKIIKNQEVRG